MKSYLLLLMPLFLLSCTNDKTVKSEKGAIDIITNIYYNASEGLEDHQQFHISKINYYHDHIIEFVPDIMMPETIDTVFYINDTLYYGGYSPIEAKSVLFSKLSPETGQNIFEKKAGAVWVNIPIYDYDKKVDLSDTVLYNRKPYKRFEINTEANYSIYYVHPTDTILPYSLNPIADKEYGGRLERIDSYDKGKDLFSTIWLIPRDTLDRAARDMIEYNLEMGGID